MPIPNYGVLKGTPTNYRNSKTANNHYQIRIDTGDTSFRIAVNVRSKEVPHDLLYAIDPNFRHPVLDTIAALPSGFTALPTRAGSGALDYLRANLFDVAGMKVIPEEQTGQNNDLNDLFDFYLKKAIQEKALVYAFGARWFPASPGKKDKYFKDTPDQGIHDIHMNQGNPAAGQFADDNGVWQDGGLFIHYAVSDTWVAVFLRFQSQAIRTDDVTGMPSDKIIPVPGVAGAPVRIVAALVNVSGAEEGREKVLLFNRTNLPVDLKDWVLTNNAQRKLVLSGELSPGATRVLTLPADVPLSNKGGILNLTDAKGNKIDGVQYTKEDAKAEDLWVVF